MTGYPWSTGDELLAADLNAAFANMAGELDYAATGAPAVCSAPDRGRALLTVEDFGAKGDGVTDDTAAFNAYATHLRNFGTGWPDLTTYFGYRQFTLGHSRVYLLAGSVNLTALNNTTLEGNGSTIIGAPVTAGTATLDAVRSEYLTFQNFTFISRSANCKYGIQVGRPLSGVNKGGPVCLYNVFMDGSFGVACIYNRAAESSNFINCTLQNRANATNAYVVIMDGDCSFPITSQFAATYNPGNPTVPDEQPPGTLQSFVQQTFIGSTLASWYGTALWMSNLRAHKYINCYMEGFIFGGGSGPAAILSYIPGGEISDLHWDVHVEPATPTSCLRIVGTVAAPVIRNLYFNEHYLMTGTAIALGAGVTSLTIHNLDMHIAGAAAASVNVFDNSAHYTILGCRAYVGLGITFNAAAITQGMVNANGTFPQGFLPLNGVTNGSGAAAGQVGEYLRADVTSGSATTLGSGVTNLICALPLTAGDWDVSGSGILSTTVGVGVIAWGIATGAAFSGDALARSEIVSGGPTLFGSGTQMAVGPVRVSLAVTTTIYLICNIVFASGTTTAWGSVGARRAR